MSAALRDDKDWTWVLERRCAQCGAEVRELPRASLPARLAAGAGAIAATLAPPAAALATRPAPAVWSGLEYGCHVRDVLRLAERRCELMLERDDAVFANWDQDATALEDRYGEQDPCLVACETAAAGLSIGVLLGSLGEPSWGCPGRRSDGAAFSVESFARYVLHDVVHHLADVGLAPLAVALGATS